MLAPCHSRLAARLIPVLDEQVVLLSNGTVTLANQAAADLFKLSVDNMQGKQAGELLDPVPPFPAAGGQSSFVAHVLTPEGKGPLVSGVVLGLESQEHLWVLKGNLALAELGALTAGLLHNLAAPLSVIRSTAELLDRFWHKAVEELPELRALSARWPESVREGGTAVIKQVDLLSDAIRDLLAKLRGESTHRWMPLDLNQILRAELELLNSISFCKHKVRKEIELTEPLPRVRGLYSDFSHSFRNLFKNALEAMAHSTERVLGVHTGLEEGGIVVRVSDTGCGIPPDIQTRIFEPFFSAGGGEQGGLGLGLHSVCQLLDPYGVRLKVESRPGRTVFTLKVPVGEDGEVG